VGHAAWLANIGNPLRASLDIAHFSLCQKYIRKMHHLTEGRTVLLLQ
jgi:hypothetical protein